MRFLIGQLLAATFVILLVASMVMAFFGATPMTTTDLCERISEITEHRFDCTT